MNNGCDNFKTVARRSRCWTSDFFADRGVLCQNMNKIKMRSEEGHSSKKLDLRKFAACAASHHNVASKINQAKTANDKRAMLDDKHA